MEALIDGNRRRSVRRSHVHPGAHGRRQSRRSTRSWPCTTPCSRCSRQRIVNLAATGPTNVGPGAADLAYGGDATKWMRLAHTLKARFLMHTQKVRPNVFPQVLAEVEPRDSEPGGQLQRHLLRQRQRTELLVSVRRRAAPGLSEPRSAVRRAAPVAQRSAAASVLQRRPLGSQRFADRAQSHAADGHGEREHPARRRGGAANGRQRHGAHEAQPARALAGLPAETGITGRPLLNEILIEEYIADFQNIEAWNLYKRTCTPNLTPTTTQGTTQGKIPARFLVRRVGAQHQHQHQAARARSRCATPPIRRRRRRTERARFARDSDHSQTVFTERESDHGNRPGDARRDGLL